MPAVKKNVGYPFKQKLLISFANLRKVAKLLLLIFEKSANLVVLIQLSD